MVINKNEDFNNLPAAYQLYPNGKQQCNNCKFYEPSGYCSVWKAIVQEFAWCKKYKGVEYAT